MSHVFVVDADRKPLNLVHPGRARLLLAQKKTALSQELVEFDLQQLENPEISGLQYQQGTLAGYEVRHYLLEKWDRACSYCGILAQARAPLKDAAAVNVTRWALFKRLGTLGLPVECGSGGLTTFNRTVRELPKAHWIDAACVGKSTPEQVHLAGVVPLLISATGHGSRQKCNVNEMGFPCSKPKGAKKVKGFQTGDIVRAVVTSGAKQGVYVGRVLVRASGSFDIRTNLGRVQGISYRFCTPVHRCDGYSYMKGAGHCSPV
jgi:hypothetical protein